MKEVRISFNFIRDINHSSQALEMLKLLKKFEIKVEKIGFYEPININFSEEKFIEMWVQGEDDLYSFIARIKNTKGYINFHSLKGGLPGYVGFDFVISSTSFYKEEKWVKLFHIICEEWDPFRASISRSFEEREKYMYEIGYLRPKEVEWLNYWNKQLISEDLKVKLDDLKWDKSIQFGNGFVYQLTENVEDTDVYPMGELAREKLGSHLLYKRSENEDDLD